jgi:hypothetical protein
LKFKNLKDPEEIAKQAKAKKLQDAKDKKIAERLEKRSCIRGEETTQSCKECTKEKGR